jgi:L-threonylcarbamoyladenylate synthase
MNSPAAPSAERILPPFTAAQRERILAALRAGRVLAYPTETSYALGGNALSPILVEAIYRLKGRGRDKPLLLLVDASNGLGDWVSNVSGGAQQLMARLWPGALTLVCAAGPGLPPHLADARGTVALRWSPHPLVAELLALGGVPLIGTSANRGGAPSLNSAQAVQQAFPGEPLLAIDGGPAPGGPPSTVLDVTVRPFRVVRQGAVTVAAIRAALGGAFPDDAPPMYAPGMTHTMVLAGLARTRSVGLALGHALPPRALVLVSGAMGAGKTTLIKAVCEGLGADPKAVISPTYTLVNVYPRSGFPAGATVYHVDLYRLDGPEALLELDRDDWIHPQGVTLIEWPEIARPLLRGEAVLELRLADAGVEWRTLTIEGAAEFAAAIRAAQTAGHAP